MSRYPPGEERNAMGGVGGMWYCNFPPQGDCVAGIGGADEVFLAGDPTHPEQDVWRCIEDWRVKTGGECDNDLCGTCVEAMKSRAKIHLSSNPQRLRTSWQNDESSNGKLFFKMQYTDSVWRISVKKCQGLPTFDVKGRGLLRSLVKGKKVRPFIRFFSLPSVTQALKDDTVSEMGEEVPTGNKESDSDKIHTFDWDMGWTLPKELIWMETVVFQLWTENKQAIGEVQIPMWTRILQLNDEGFSEVASLGDITSRKYGDLPVISRRRNM